MPLESSITSSILKYLNALPYCMAEKIAGGSFQKGKPDIYGCWRGRMFKIEVKTPDHGNKPTPLQARHLKEWAKVGCVCFTAYSLKEVKERINEERCD